MISDAEKREKVRVRKAEARRGDGIALTGDEASLHGAMADIIGSEPADARSFFDTAGIGDMLVQAARTGDLWPLFRAHYSTRGRIDAARFATDLARWPLIANRIAEVRAEAA